MDKLASVASLSLHTTSNNASRLAPHALPTRWSPGAGCLPPPPVKSSLPWRPGCPPRPPCNSPCTRSSASRSSRDVSCTDCFSKLTSSSVATEMWVQLCGSTIQHLSCTPTAASQRRAQDHLWPRSTSTVWVIRNGADSIHPLDEAMHLPRPSFSYELQKRMVKAAIQGPFRESTRTDADMTGMSLLQAQPGRDHPGRSTRLRRLLPPSASPSLKPTAPFSLLPSIVRAFQWSGRDSPALRQAHQGGKGQSQEDGHGRRRIHSRALGTDAPAGGGKPVPHRCQEGDRTRPDPSSSLPNTNGSGPACSKARRLSSTKSSKRCSVAIPRIRRFTSL